VQIRRPTIDADTRAGLDVSRLACESKPLLAVTRRSALACVAGAGLLGAMFAASPVMAQVASRRRELLWGTLELNLGSPSKLIPQAAILNCQVESKVGFSSETARWRALVAKTQHVSPERKLQLIHAEIQKVPYRLDLDATGSSDKWAHPLEFLHSGGDCEDYAIAKFKTLEAAGFPASDMRVVIVRNSATSGFHAVLVAFIDGQASVLDNLSSIVYQPAQQTTFDPICSLDRNSLWLHWNGSDLNTRVALLRERLSRLA
jgi:predicted transglutaminase-like cysteine proteinase